MYPSCDGQMQLFAILAAIIFRLVLFILVFILIFALFLMIFVLILVVLIVLHIQISFCKYASADTDLHKEYAQKSINYTRFFGGKRSAISSAKRLRYAKNNKIATKETTS